MEYLIYGEQRKNHWHKYDNSGKCIWSIDNDVYHALEKRLTHYLERGVKNENI